MSGFASAFRRYLVLFTLPLITFGCGGKGSLQQPEPPLPERKPEPRNGVVVPDDINKVWRVANKSCDGQGIATQPLESYRIDNHFFVKVVKASEEAGSLCKSGYVYDKILSSFGRLESGVYWENATLAASALKKTCWKKENGVVVEPPISNDSLEFGNEQLAMKLSALNNGGLVLEIQKSKECQGTLAMALVHD